jgi:hypothetical protein
MSSDEESELDMGKLLQNPLSSSNIIDQLCAKQLEQKAQQQELVETKTRLHTLEADSTGKRKC